MDKIAVIKAVTGAILSGLQSVNRDPGLPVEIPAGPIQKEAAGQIAKEVMDLPQIQHATNTERHWWQQRSKWASIFGTISTFATTGAAFAPPQYQELALTIAGSTSALAAYLGLRAGQATKPLFSS